MWKSCCINQCGMYIDGCCVNLYFDVLKCPLFISIYIYIYPSVLEPSGKLLQQQRGSS